jgi:hypothetical protein|tara:strand:- start:224 stop:583 length:360 start_codon:yes stop_codon:yes gene_type:complete
MKNLSKKRNYKLTGNTARIKTGSIWPSYLAIAMLFSSIGFGGTYYYFDGGKSIKFLLTINELKEFNSLKEKELLELKLELKMSQISYEKISMNLRESKKENTDLKESILFYEKIVGKRR